MTKPTPPKTHRQATYPGNRTLELWTARGEAAAKDPDRADTTKRRKREGKPKLATNGDSRVGAKTSLAVLAATEDQLSTSTKLWFMGFLWTYQPGRVWRRSARYVGKTICLSERATYRATRELKTTGYLKPCEDGWICPPIERKLPPEQQADRIRQLDFENIEPSWTDTRNSLQRSARIYFEKA